ncbi:ArgB Acetylglutamate kinase [actinobacterium SCGC AAA044-D11]
MILFKYGGHAISDSQGIDPVLALLSKEISAGKKIIIVHGGGPAINKELEIHGVKSEMVGGLRKTTPEILEVVQRTLCGEVQRKLVNQLIALGVNAVGLTAGDGNLTRAKISKPELGLVGEVVSVNPDYLISQIDIGITPVISPISITPNGQAVNMNADIIAGAIGGALKAESVLFSTDVSGIYRNWPDKNSLIQSINVEELTQISQTFEGGMIPKAESAINAIKSGAKKVQIFDGRDIFNIELALKGEGGTLVLSQ